MSWKYIKPMKVETFVKRLKEMSSTCPFIDMDSYTKEQRSHIGFLIAEIDNRLVEWDDMLSDYPKNAQLPREGNCAKTG